MKTVIFSAACACLIAPVTSNASSFEEALKEARTSLDKAKAVNYEWRDSRKILETAEKLNKEGQSKQAIKLAEAARKQGELAVAQAELQSTVRGPR